MSNKQSLACGIGILFMVLVCSLLQCRKRRDFVTDVLRQGHSQFVVRSVAYEPLILGSKYPPEDFSRVIIVAPLFFVVRSICQLTE